MPTSNPRIPRSFENLFEYEGFLTILRYYVDLNCFVALPDTGRGGQTWLAVNYNLRPSSLFDFQKKYDYKFSWEKFTDPDFERSHPKGQPLLLRALGFYDIFMPIRRNGKRLGTVFSGAFSDRELTYSQLQESWKELSGQSASGENGEFREFARVLLEIPVLEGATLLAYREALELFALALAGDRPSRKTKRMQELMTDIFSKQFPHSYWMDWALGLPTRQATPLWNIGIQEMDWIKNDIGIKRIPTTILTAIPLNPAGRKRDPVEEMLRIYRFQRRS